MAHTNINKVIVTGNLTRDPELSVPANGNAILKFGIAVTDYSGNGGYTNFFDVVVFGKRAEGVAKYLSKGSKVAVSGKLHWGSWTDKQGNKRSSVNINADEVELLGESKKKEEPIVEVAPEELGFYNEDIPF